jgi:hypothetical protein
VRRGILHDADPPASLGGARCVPHVPGMNGAQCAPYGPGARSCVASLGASFGARCAPYGASRPPLPGNAKPA